MVTKKVQEKRGVPKLRFSGFEGEWEEKKAGEIFENLSDKNHLGDLPLLAVTQNDGVVYRSDLELKINSSEEGIKNYKIINPGNFVISLRSFQGGIEYSKIKGISSPAYTVLKSKIKIDDDFYRILFKKQSFINKLNSLIYGIRDGKQISYSEFKFLKLTYPKPEEQQKIASFFGSVDEWIENLKEQKENIELYKKGMMQKIFSQEICFKDEKGKKFPEWDKKKLSSFLVERSESSPKSVQHPLMAFVAYIGVTPKGDRYNREFLVNDVGSKNYKRTEYGDFIYSSNNLETGSLGLNLYGSASISPVYSIFKIGESCDHQFIHSYLTRKSFINKMIRYRQGVVYGQWKIHESEFLKIEENIPSVKEQQKIADFLTSLDKVIESKQQQISQAEQWKKGLMQGLFV